MYDPMNAWLPSSPSRITVMSFTPNHSHGVSQYWQLKATGLTIGSLASYIIVLHTHTRSSLHTDIMYNNT